MNTKPTLNEWKKSNPGKGINEYFQEYPNADNLAFGQINQFHQHSIKESKKEEISFGNVIFSLLIGIGFVSPWINIKPLGILTIIECNGYQIPQLIETFTTGSSDLIQKSIYLIPIGALMTIFGESIKNWLVRMVSQIIVIFVVIYWAIMLFQLTKAAEYQLGFSIDYFKVFNYGFYLTGLATLYYVYDIFFAER